MALRPLDPVTGEEVHKIAKGANECGVCRHWLNRAADTLDGLATENADLRRQLAEAEGRTFGSGWMPIKMVYRRGGVQATVFRAIGTDADWHWRVTGADGHEWGSPIGTGWEDALKQCNETIAAAKAAQGDAREPSPTVDADLAERARHGDPEALKEYRRIAEAARGEETG